MATGEKNDGGEKQTCFNMVVNLLHWPHEAKFGVVNHIPNPSTSGMPTPVISIFRTWFGETPEARRGLSG
jgi:hypothetical protein